MSWDCRTDPMDGDLGLRWGHKVVLGGEPRPKELCFIGLASDEGVRRNQGRLGAADGPDSLRRSLANLPFLPQLRLRDLGDVHPVGEDLEAAQDSFASGVAWAVQKFALPVGLGGGHEITYATYSGLRQARPKDRLGLIYFDAHFDLREDSWRTSGTSIRDILTADSNVQALAVGISPASNTLKLFETADDLGVKFVMDEELLDAELGSFPLSRYGPLRFSPGGIPAWIEEVDCLYVSFDLDVLPAHEAPGVSAPAGWGVPYSQLRKILQPIVRSGKVKALDVAELNPSFDLDGRTSRLAARIIWDVAAWRI